MFGRNKFGIIIVQAMSQRMNVYVCVCGEFKNRNHLKKL